MVVSYKRAKGATKTATDFEVSWLSHTSGKKELENTLAKF